MLPTVVSDRAKEHAKVRTQEGVDSYRALVGPQYIDGLIPVEANPLVWWKKYAVNFPYLSEGTGSA